MTVTAARIPVNCVSSAASLLGGMVAAIFFTLGCNSRDNLPARHAVFEEAVCGWKQFDRQYSISKGYWSTKQTVQRGSVIESRFEFKRKREQVLVVQHIESGQFKGKKAFAVNQHYAFGLKQALGQSHWSVTMTGKPDDAEVKRLLSESSMSVYSPINLLRDSLMDAITKPYFGVQSVREIRKEENTYVEIDFTYEHPYVANGSEPFNWVQGGTLVLWPRNLWVIKQAVFRMQQGGGAEHERFIAEVTFEYNDDLEANGRFPIARREVYRAYASDFDVAMSQPVSVETLTVFSVAPIDESDLPDDDFTLKAFGLADVDHGLRATWRPSSYLILMFCSFIVLVLAWKALKGLRNVTLHKSRNANL